MDSAKLVWVTRSSPYNLLTAHRLRAMGHHALTVPVLRIQRVEAAPILQRPDAIVFTSSHGVRHHDLQPELLDVPVYTVGDHTAGAAQRAGYCSVVSARGNVLNLQKLIASTVPRGARLLHLGAEKPAGELCACLRHLGFEASRMTVYRSEEANPLDLKAAVDALSVVNAITVHSPRGAAKVAEVLEATQWTGELFCISEACSKVFLACSGLTVKTANQPNEASLLSLLRQRVGHEGPPPNDRRPLFITGPANDNVRKLKHEISEGAEGELSNPAPRAG